ncbi:septum formation inhibitor Maf [Desulfovibrio desulfuricans]|uniref:dTTP/UTP pyrophosphatase n=1 Tax=Desulfovibrio desulfuricans TaxID=876 RepID=A0A4P7UNB8_DESDE|nr:Maf family protein [Desulfovibrio desulfuricans]QCC85062.1 septum formation inhibitor Maf [Desulfovibrio desulfuricans]
MTSSLCHCAPPAGASEILCPLFRLSPGFELLLASGSPRRRQFLNEWGLPFRLALPNAEEPRPLQGEPPEAYTRRAATAKALAVAQTLRQQAAHKAADGAPAASPQPVILAADTVVAIGGDILGKPDNPAHALSMLARLNGASHEVISAVCLLLPAQPALTPAAQALADVPASISYTEASASGNANTAFNLQETLVGSFCMLTFSDVSRVFFHHWPMPVLQAYVDTGEPTDKAGAYAIQGQGAVLVERVEGSWSTVVGLPVTALAQVMMDRGLMLPCRC